MTVPPFLISGEFTVQFWSYLFRSHLDGGIPLHWFWILYNKKARGARNKFHTQRGLGIIVTILFGQWVVEFWLMVFAIIRLSCRDAPRGVSTNDFDWLLMIKGQLAPRQLEITRLWLLWLETHYDASLQGREYAGCWGISSSKQTMDNKKYYFKLSL